MILKTTDDPFTSKDCLVFCSIGSPSKPLGLGPLLKFIITFSSYGPGTIYLRLVDKMTIEDIPTGPSAYWMLTTIKPWPLKYGQLSFEKLWKSHDSRCLVKTQDTISFQRIILSDSKLEGWLPLDQIRDQYRKLMFSICKKSGFYKSGEGGSFGTNSE